MNKHQNGPHEQPIQADTSREVAEIVADKLRKLGCPVTPQVVDFIESQVEAEVAKFLAAEHLIGIARLQLDTPLRGLGRQVEQMTREISRSMVNG